MIRLIQGAHCIFEIDPDLYIMVRFEPRRETRHESVAEAMNMAEQEDGIRQDGWRPESVRYFKAQFPSEWPEPGYEGICTLYWEIDSSHWTLRQLEAYVNGKVRSYDHCHWHDSYGGLCDQQTDTEALDAVMETETDFHYEEITVEEFDRIWASHTPINR